MINSIKHEALIAFIKESRVPVVIIHPAGKIVWANRSFCRWTGYTHAELATMSWKRLVAADSAQAADDAFKTLDVEHTVEFQAQLIPKNDRPNWGTLSGHRWPVTGDLEYCVCTWEPLRMSGLGFDELRELSLKINTLVHQSEEDRWVLSTLGLIRKYPKVAVTLLITTLGIFGINNAAELLERFHILPAVNIETRDK